VGIPTYYFRNMLLQYDRQLVAARRLARLRSGMNAEPVYRAGSLSVDETPGEGETLSAETRRRIMIEHVARELLDNLMFTGSDNPVVEEVREELDRTMGGRYSFWYPPGEVDVRIALDTPDGPRELTSEEHRQVLTALWDITLAKVDATML